MFVHVKLLQYYEKIFTYKVPHDLISSITINTIVCVPLKKKVVPAIVLHYDQKEKKYPFHVKDIISIYKFPNDTQYIPFLKKIGHLYQVDYSIFVNRIAQFLSDKEESVPAPILENEIEKPVIHFSLEQKKVIETIHPFLHTKQFQSFLLHGVTGSGKTEIYKFMIQELLNQEKSVIIMLPEVSLALRFEQIFKQSFSSSLIYSFHCASSTKNKQNLCNALIAQKPMIIIGVHLPILLPIANLGGIIVDEEHDAGYQEKKHPKLHSRDLAILKASDYHVPILLGSATPSIQSIYHAKQKNWITLHMINRYAGNFPEIKIISLKDNKKRAYFWFTDQLIEAIHMRLQKKEQTIIFLNRRGFSFFVQCPCGHVLTCNHCSVSLTLHEGSKLLCHYCGFKEIIPSTCPTCHQTSNDFLKKGVGTQQVVSLLSKIFPNAVIERADLDSTSKKRSWEKTVQAMYDGNIDILVGTQSITKGYHFEKVTLIGVIWADLNLHFPIYNATEVCLQQLIQVAGRAGRQSSDSLVIVQTFDDHPIFKFIHEHNYQQFYEYEIQKRIAVQYPPYKHLAEIEIKHHDPTVLNHQSLALVNILQQTHHAKNFEIFGPVPSVIHKMMGTYANKIYLKSFSRTTLMHAFEQLPKQDMHINLTINPVQ